MILPFTAPHTSRRQASTGLQVLLGVLALVHVSSCRSAEKPTAWKGEGLDPVTSQAPLQGAPTQGEREGEVVKPRPAVISVNQSAGVEQAEMPAIQPAEREAAGGEAAVPAKSTVEKAATSEEEEESVAFQIEKKTRESYHAELELEIAEQKAASAEAKAVGALQDAQAEQVAALEAAQQYAKVEAPQLLAAAQLGIDEQRFKLEMAEQELQQMEEEYSRFQEDEHAAQTGKIVIWRETQKAGWAKRSLTLAEARMQSLEGYTIPRKKRELQLALAKAERKVQRAKEDQVRVELENKLSLRKAKDRQGILKYELGKLREQLSDI